MASKRHFGRLSIPTLKYDTVDDFNRDLERPFKRLQRIMAELDAAVIRAGRTLEDMNLLRKDGK